MFSLFFWSIRYHRMLLQICCKLIGKYFKPSKPHSDNFHRATFHNRTSFRFERKINTQQHLAARVPHVFNSTSPQQCYSVHEYARGSNRMSVKTKPTIIKYERFTIYLSKMLKNYKRMRRKKMAHTTNSYQKI